MKVENRASIEFEEVVSAIKALKKLKKQVNVIAIREITNKGSYTTIKKHLVNFQNGIAPTYKDCNKCNGTGKLKERAAQQKSPDIDKMKDIMRRKKLKINSLAKLLGISNGAVQGWFHVSTNTTGKIKKLYFDILKLKGIK
jgi:DNA-binding transcriptional regulator YiaG